MIIEIGATTGESGVLVPGCATERSYCTSQTVTLCCNVRLRYEKINVTVSYFVKNRADDMHLTVGWLVDEVNLPLSAVMGYLWEDGDDMRMICHEMRE